MRKIPLLDLPAQYSMIRWEVRKAIDRVCDTQHFILGPEVAALEQKVAAFCGAKFAVGVSSGTDALLAALMAVEVGPGDEVITSPFSFFASAGVISRVGARPVFADIEAESFNLDPDAIASAVTRRTKAILPVHLFGCCAAMDPIMEFANAQRLHVVEDAAQAIGATIGTDRMAGTVGSLGCYSFFPSKNLGAFGDGGMIVTQDGSLAEAVRLLRVHGAKPKYHHRTVGGNFRLDELQAAVLRIKLKYLPIWTEARRRNAQLYRDLFAEAGLLGEVVLPKDTPGHVYNQFVIRCPRRDPLRAHLDRRGIETEVYYPLPLHLQECFARLGYRQGDFPRAEAAACEVLALPIYPELTVEQQTYIVQSIGEFYEQGRVISPADHASLCQSS